MELLHLMTEYVFRTQPTADVSVFFLMLQTILQSAAPAMLLVSAMKRRPVADRFLLAIVPMVFFVTYVFMDVLLGGSFLGGGFHHLPELVVYLTKTPRLWWEAGAVLALFSAAFFTARRWGRSNLFSLLGDVSVWGLWALAAYTTAYLAKNGSMPALGPLKPGDVALWYVYAVYTVLAQLLLNLTALAMHVLFRPWRPKGDPEVAAYDDAWCRRVVARLLSEGHRVFLCAMGPLALLLYVLVGPALVTEGEAGDWGMFLAFMGPLTLWCLFILYRVVFPQTLPAVRRVLSWDREERLPRRFCKEYFDPAAPPVEGGAIQLTRSFLLDRTSLRSGLYYLPWYQGKQLHVQGRRLLFRDGGTLELDRLPIRDRMLLMKALSPSHLENRKH